MQQQQYQQNNHNADKTQQQQQHWSPDAYPSDSNVSEGNSTEQNLTPPQPAYSPMPQEDNHLHYNGHYQMQQQQMQLVYCPGCGIKAPMAGSATCSRRCTWLCNHQCPQCGKPKPDGFVYCSRTCSYQSSQANWCASCGVCQTDLSGFCVNLDCIGAQPSQQQQQPQSFQQQHPPQFSNSYNCGGSSTASGTPPPEMMTMAMHQQMTPHPSMNFQQRSNNYHHHQPSMMPGGGRRGSNSKMECRVMNNSEIARSGIPTVFSAIFAHRLGVRLVSVLKLTSSAVHRKKYLSYRSIVENQMASVGVPKYGHGGEGNEQRRYFGIPLQCDLGRDTAPSGSAAPAPAPPSAIGGGHNRHHETTTAAASQPNLRTCHDPTCVACSVVTKGLELYSTGASSHYCNTTSTSAVQYLEPSPTSGLKAMMVARVVVGNPEVHYVDQNTEAPFIQAPQDPTFNHSMVLTNNDTNLDGTYIFTDEAVDPQYLVLFE